MDNPFPADEVEIVELWSHVADDLNAMSEMAAALSQRLGLLSLHCKQLTAAVHVAQQKADKSRLQAMN